ncbi:MAG: polymerase sigma-B factor [Acidimicrobiaceae bacterium]|jgi:RNA polymerase sigma-B factor
MVPADPQVTARFMEYRRTGDVRVRNEIVADHRWIAIHCARRFARRGEPLDDLVQVAQLGLVKAADRFDPSFGVLFPTFAMPTILGELRRHFRDHTWPVRVPRRSKELYLALSGCVETLGHVLGRRPTIEELAEEMSASVDEVLEALEAGAVYRTAPLVPPAGPDDDDNEGLAGMTLGEVDTALLSADVRLSVRQLMGRLPARERRVLFLRFFDGRTQSEIAAQLGISQVHVSRIIRSTLGRMRTQLATAEAV